MNNKVEKEGVMLVTGLYEPNILSLFEQEKNSIKPFISFYVNNQNYLISNKKKFLDFIGKNKKNIIKVEIDKKFIIFYTARKMIKYQIIPINLKLDLL